MNQPLREHAAGTPLCVPESDSAPASAVSECAFESVAAAYAYFHELTAKRMKRVLQELGAPDALFTA